MANTAFVANRASSCRKCQNQIKPGDRVCWAGKGVVQHERCSSAWREAQQHPNGPILPLLQQAKEPAPELTKDEWDQLLAFDDATSSVPMVEGGHADRSEVRGEAVEPAPARQRAASAEHGRADVVLPSAAAEGVAQAPLQPGSPAGRPSVAGEAQLLETVRELRATVGGLAATVRVLATAVEYIAKAIPPDRYLVPADHWTRRVESTDAGKELATGDPL